MNKPSGIDAVLLLFYFAIALKNIPSHTTLFANSDTGRRDFIFRIGLGFTAERSQQE
jgi:hypothetical protein